MKILKNISIILIQLIVLIGIIITGASTIWYLLPGIQESIIGDLILSVMSLNGIMWTAIGCGAILVLLTILLPFLMKKSSAKYKNFYTHLHTWVYAVIVIGFSILSFIFTEPLISAEVIISNTTKILLSVCIMSLLLFHIFASKIQTIINRRIQAYETAKEVNTVGRSSIIFTNLLKMFEIFFPELIVMFIICLCVSWSVASFFILLVVASFIPVIGNMMCDFTTRRDIIRKNKIEKEQFAKQVANNIKK